MKRSYGLPDLVLAPYAMSLGFEPRGHLDVSLKHPGASALFNEDGVILECMQFNLGDVHVWMTARGWRVSRLRDGTYERPADSDFYANLKDALDAGARNWRDR